MHKDKVEEWNQINACTIPELYGYHLLDLEFVFLIFWMILLMNDWNTPNM